VGVTIANVQQVASVLELASVGGWHYSIWLSNSFIEAPGELVFFARTTDDAAPGAGVIRFDFYGPTGLERIEFRSGQTVINIGS
jgi:hypothetical protein